MLQKIFKIFLIPPARTRPAAGPARGPRAGSRRPRAPSGQRRAESGRPGPAAGAELLPSWWPWPFLPGPFSVFYMPEGPSAIWPDPAAGLLGSFGLSCSWPSVCLGRLGQAAGHDLINRSGEKTGKERAPGGRFAPGHELASFRSFRSFGHRNKIAPARLSQFVL